MMLMLIRLKMMILLAKGIFPPTPGEFHLDGGKDENQDGDDPDDDQLIASSSCIRRKCFFHAPDLIPA